MSTKYPGGFITKDYVPPTTTSASGIWTLEQQEQAQQAGIWPFGGPFTYIEDVFSTYLYTGTGATQTITNGIDLSTKGGLVWTKSRTNPAGTYDGWHALVDTVRGTNSVLYSNATDSYSALNTYVSAFNTNGFNLGAGTYDSNKSSYTYVSWTFRKQPKFFDIVTYTGTGAARTIAHNLGSVPGCIIVKNLTTASDWRVYHRGLTSAVYDIRLNLTNAQASVPSAWNSTAPTSTVFSLGANTDTNGSGDSYVAYIFAHNAGGFGLTGTDNVISCGSFTVSGNVASVNLGYEPQWLLIKKSSATGNWGMKDVMRGGLGATSSGTNVLYSNYSDAEATSGNWEEYITSTGFGVTNMVDADYIYIAIRRGPMKVPTVGTSVYYPFARAGNDTQTNITGVGFTPDLWMVKSQNIAAGFPWFDRLRGVTKRVDSTSTYLEETFSGDNGLISLNMDGITIGSGPADGGICNDTGTNYGNWLLKRAPSFFDEVCYTGTGSNTTQTHNLAKIPELIIVKERDAIGAWQIYSSALANTEYLVLNTTAAKATGATRWNSTTPTSTVFSIGTDATVNASAGTYVAYLFATCAGVSKVGSYSGTGATQTVDCGFSGGARWVMVKRTDSTGDWYVWDTARGMVSGTDPSLLLNSTAAEVNANSIYTATTGFQIVSTAAGINASGGTYIFLAIA